MDKFKVGVVGAATPVGAELIKLLSRHPIVELTAISSLAHQGKPICEVFPALLGLCDKILVSDTEVLVKSDIVFCCDTALSTHDLAARCIKAKCVFIDLGATFRIDGEDNYREWIGGEYEYPELHEAAVYGLPELLRDRLPGKVIAAIPGAVATGAILALAPALFGGLVLPEGIVVDALCPGSCGDIISDVSLPHPETFETERMLTLAAGKTVRLAINAHRAPVSRGMIITCYAKGILSTSEKTLRNVYEKMYAQERFISLLPSGAAATSEIVAHTNRCAISIAYESRTATAVITAVLDDMLKGSAGQALQCMNIMLSMPEELGME